MSTREGYRWQSKPWSPSGPQARILDGVARGLTNAQIAAEVGISVDGVKWHVSRALSETGLEARTDLALWWQSPQSDTDIRMHTRVTGHDASAPHRRLDLGFIRTPGPMASRYVGPLLLPRPGSQHMAALDSCPGIHARAQPISM